MAHRLVAMGVAGYASDGDEPITEKRASGVHWSGVVRTAAEPNPSTLPTRLAVSRLGYRPRVFVTSMADLFHEDVPYSFLANVFRIMSQREDIDFLVLTKRADVMADFAERYGAWPENAWAGATVEDQKRADERISHLLRVPARVRFLSMEPLLGPVRLPGNYLGQKRWAECNDGCYGPGYELLDGGIHLVIAGGESGLRARPSHPTWFRDLRDQCVSSNVAFHFKQWGEWCSRGPDSMSPNYASVEGVPRVKLSIDGSNASTDRTEHGVRPGPGPRIGEDDCWMQRVGKKAAGRLLDGRTWDEVPTAQPAEVP